MKKFVFLLLFCGFTVFSQNEKIFEEANEAYTSGNYKEAVRQYEQVIKNGETSAELYYNLANSYYKLEEVAPSIFYYEKALQLAPGDSDIKNNLAIAKQLTIDDIGTYELTGFSKFLHNLQSSLGSNTTAWVAIFSSFAFLIFFILYFFSVSSKKKRIFFSTTVLFVFIAVFSSASAYLLQEEGDQQQYAIIFSEAVDIRNEPTQSANEIFMLHEGAKIKITETFQGWVKIELPDEKQGWILQEEVKFL